MPAEYWQWIAKGAAIVFATLFIKQAYKAQQLIELEKELEKAEVYDFRRIDQMSTGESIFINAKLKNNDENKVKTEKTFIRKLHYNEFYLEEPSDYRIISEIQRFNKEYPFDERNIFTFVDWRGTEKNFCGIDKIVGDVYEIKCTHQINISTFKRFIGFFAYCAQFLIDKVRKSGFHDKSLTEVRKDRAPFILGPVIGTLKSSVEIVADQSLLLKVILENGLHKISIISQSKGYLSNFCSSLSIKYQTRAILYLLLTIATSFYSYRNNFKRIKKILHLLTSRVKQGFKQKMLQLRNVQQFQTCTICYVNCRNVILFNCNHLALCWECFKDLKSQQCCHCKAQIKGIQIVYADRIEAWRKTKKKSSIRQR